MKRSEFFRATLGLLAAPFVKLPEVAGEGVAVLPVETVGLCHPTWSTSVGVSATITVTGTANESNTEIVWYDHNGHIISQSDTFARYGNWSLL